MAEVIKAVTRHACQEELDQLDTSELWLGSVAECSCGKRFVWREHQFDGTYWAEATVGDETLRLNQPMVARLRKCAADTSPNWDGQITIYPPEARELVALIDAATLVRLDEKRKFIAALREKARWHIESESPGDATLNDLADAMERELASAESSVSGAKAVDQ